jgi:hypothetical protein
MFKPLSESEPSEPEPHRIKAPAPARPKDAAPCGSGSATLLFPAKYTEHKKYTGSTGHQSDILHVCLVLFLKLLLYKSTPLINLENSFVAVIKAKQKCKLD